MQFLQNMGDSFLFHSTFPEFSVTVDGACVFVSPLSTFPEAKKKKRRGENRKNVKCIISCPEEPFWKQFSQNEQAAGVQ